MPLLDLRFLLLANISFDTSVSFVKKWENFVCIWQKSMSVILAKVPGVKIQNDVFEFIKEGSCNLKWRTLIYFSQQYCVNCDRYFSILLKLVWWNCVQKSVVWNETKFKIAIFECFVFMRNRMMDAERFNLQFLFVILEISTDLLSVYWI